MLNIITGGQTGVDRGALDTALAAGVECGGWCPAGRLAEDGRIPNRYPLIELPGAGYPERTARNVAESDGTLIITFGDLQGGTRTTLECCIQQRKPHLVIDAAICSAPDAVRRAREFVQRFTIRTLNVAGPRASEAADAYDFGRRIVDGMLA